MVNFIDFPDPENDKQNGIDILKMIVYGVISTIVKLFIDVKDNDSQTVA